jgi:predicted metal-dependent peptidase
MQIEMQESRIKTVTQYVISKCPSFALFVLWCPYRVTIADYLVRTGGRSVCFGARFFTHPPLEQAAILVHATLHVALCHVPRAKRDREHKNKLLWNVCADAIINEAIVKMGWLALPAERGREPHAALHALEWLLAQEADE